MTADFEPVFERKFHAYLNWIEGVMHTGQRDLIRIRVSKNTFNAGLRLKDLAEVLYVKLKSDFDTVVDKCQVTIITDPAQCAAFRQEVAVPAYNHRDARLKNLTDENVDQFYTCILCQSFSPSHVCIVTPERLGLCGAVSWLDAKATNELGPTRPWYPPGWSWSMPRSTMMWSVHMSFPRRGLPDMTASSWAPMATIPRRTM